MIVDDSFAGSEAEAFSCLRINSSTVKTPLSAGHFRDVFEREKRFHSPPAGKTKSVYL